MPLPEFYDDWDPQQHDLETERLDSVGVRHWKADLRALQSEVEAEREERREKAMPPRHDYRAIREAFEAEHPKPDEEDVDALADWEWRLQERIFEVTENDSYLHRHRMERGAYVKRYAAMHRRSKAWFEETFGPLRKLPRKPGGWEPIPWPDGDGLRWRRKLAEVGRYDDLPEGALDEPSYDAAEDLDAGLRGWFQSLYEHEREPTAGFRREVEEAVRLIERAYRTEYLPGDVGDDQLALRRAVLRCQDALDMLDGFRGNDWMTPAAFDRLCELIETARDAASDRYVVLRDLYDAYRQRAARVLGAQGAPDVPGPPPEHPLLPPGYDPFDPEAYAAEKERLDEQKHRHWQNDLRNLRSEVEAERLEQRRRSRTPRYDISEIYRAFEEAHPKPPDDDPDAQAEWEWRRLETYYETTGSVLLHRHRMERGAFIARCAARLWDSKNHLDAVRRQFEGRPPSPPSPREPDAWPVGDGVSEPRRETLEEGDLDIPDGALDEPSFDRAVGLWSVSFAWPLSLEEEAWEVAESAASVLRDAAHAVMDAYASEYRPATIGGAQRSIRRGILAYERTLDLMDGLRGYDWFTDRAYRRLRELVEEGRDAAVERYADLRALYDAYRERALRILGPEGAAGV